MGRQARSNLVVIIILLVLIPPGVPAADVIYPVPTTTIPTSPADTCIIRLFVPEKGSIHSSQVQDLVNTNKSGEIILATTFGLATYNGTWNVQHRFRDNLSAGLMDDYITAIEYDNEGNLWLGYSGGIQVYNGIYYRVFRDQELLKDPRVTDLQRWNDDMWIATGNSGLHRVHAGNWTWFKPSETGKNRFYEADSLALDSARNYLIIATQKEGLWMIRSTDDPVQFEMIEGKDGSYGKMEHVRRDPFGGVYFFNTTSIIHYSQDRGFTGMVTAGDLSVNPITINDIAAGEDGRLVIATDDGLYVWENNRIYRHIGRFEGIGTSPSVKTVNIDAQNRIWFSTSGYTGYYLDTSDTGTPIPIEIVTPATLIPIQTIAYLPVTLDQGTSAEILPFTLTSMTDPLIRAIYSIISGFSQKIFP
jgi:hypothetical protein